MFDSALKVATALHFLIATSVLALGSTQMFAAESDFARLRSGVVVGQHAPGTPDGVSFGGFSIVRPTAKDNGEVAFLASRAGDVSPDFNRFGAWSEAGGALHLVARDRRAAQVAMREFGEAMEFCSSLEEIAINELGMAAFHTQIRSVWGSSGYNSAGSLWRGISGSLTRQ